MTNAIEVANDLLEKHPEIYQGTDGVLLLCKDIWNKAYIETWLEAVKTMKSLVCRTCGETFDKHDDSNKLLLTFVSRAQYEIERDARFLGLCPVKKNCEVRSFASDTFPLMLKNTEDGK